MEMFSQTVGSSVLINSLALSLSLSLSLAVSLCLSRTNPRSPPTVLVSVYAVVTFLHKDVFKRPVRVDWAGQFSKKTMKHMLLGRMSCLWAPRHKEAPMRIVNIHQAGSATPELQQQVWVALQGVRAQYPEAQGVIGGDSTRMHQVTEKDTRRAMPVT
jgi:hypothetical protein